MDLTNITGITTDSRQVKPGFVFVAIKGNALDGHEYIDQAIKNGANIIIHSSDIAITNPELRYIKVEDPRQYLSQLAAQFYINQPKYILGITGTSGKSSIVHFIREILKLLEQKSVSIGTLGVLGDIEIESKLTTPATIDLHKILNEIAERNIDYVALECSSHGIDQHRLSSVKFSACGFSNLSQDHLDYHANMEEYFQVKKQLFSIMKNGCAVLNSDIKEFVILYEFCLSQNHKIISYGKAATADIRILSIEPQGLGQNVQWSIFNKLYSTQINLFGEFQIYNLACAIALIMTTGISVDRIMPILNQVKFVPGRMELVARHNDAGIFVDYAHKPEALSQALQNLRNDTKQKLWVLFGCGGERDQSKRAIMGQIACQYADYVIVTDDNPRNEDAQKIRNDILQGCNDKAIEIAQREKAIEYILNRVNNGDNVLIAGKGHEDYQIIGNEMIDFSDKEIVKKRVSL